MGNVCEFVHSVSCPGLKRGTYSTGCFWYFGLWFPLWDLWWVVVVCVCEWRVYTDDATIQHNIVPWAHLSSHLWTEFDYENTLLYRSDIETDYVSE